IAFLTRAARWALTTADPLTTADTVATDTFARRATSRIVGVVFWRGVFFGRVFGALGCFAVGLLGTCLANLPNFESFGFLTTLHKICGRLCLWGAIRNV